MTSPPVDHQPAEPAEAPTRPTGRLPNLPIGALGSGPWNVGVERGFWLVGIAILLAALAVLDGGDLFHIELTLGHVLSLAAVLVLGGWGLARWFGAPPWPERTAGGPLFAIVAWLAIARIADWLLAVLVPAPFGVGETERLLLVPAVIGLALVVGAGLRLHRYVSHVAAGMLALISVAAAGDPGDDPGARVSMAGATALGEARSTGRPILLRGTALGQAAGLEGVRPANPDRCDHLVLDDRLTTVSGLPGPRLQVSFDACWDAKGRPLSLVVVHRATAGEQAGNLVSVRLADLTPFALEGIGTGGAVGAGPTPDDPFAAYGDGEADVAEVRRSPADRFRVFDDGRVADDGDPRDDTVRALVKGNTITVAVAYEQRDPLVGDRDAAALDDSAGTYGAGFSGPDRFPALRPPPGTALHVVIAQLQRMGGSSASATRYSARGERRGAMAST